MSPDENASSKSDPADESNTPASSNDEHLDKQPIPSRPPGSLEHGNVDDGFTTDELDDFVESVAEDETFDEITSEEEPAQPPEPPHSDSDTQQDEPPQSEPAESQASEKQQVAPPAPPTETIPMDAPALPASLKNGTVGTPYHQRIETQLDEVLQRNQDLRLQIKGAEKMGLACAINGAEIEVFGTPTIAGEFTLTVSMWLPKTPSRPDVETRNFPVKLLINHDPRSLWNDKEPDSTLPYPKPNVDCARVDGDAVMIAASRRGRSHAHEGTHRDDDFNLKLLEDSGWHLMVVADGAGSAKFSRRGSQIACDVMSASVTPHFASAGALGTEFEKHVSAFNQQPTDELHRRIQNALYTALGSSAIAARKGIEKEVPLQPDSEISDFATTLIFSACKRFSFGWFIATYAVGDGGVGVLQEDEVQLLNEPDGGEFAGQTRFLTMADIWDGREILARIRYTCVKGMTALVAMTDGVSDPLFQTDNNLRNHDKWCEFWEGMNEAVSFDKSNLQSHEELLEWLNFWSKGNHDDRTIAVLIP